MMKKAFPSSSDSSTSDSEDEGPGAKNSGNKADARKKRKGMIDYKALSRHGYRGGLSILKVPPPTSSIKPDWSWSKGQPESDTSTESYAERERTRIAANSLAVALPDGGREKGKASFSQKEKRKRDIGQASRGKNYVEEEKRLLRESGVYSGFDS